MARRPERDGGGRPLIPRAHVTAWRAKAPWPTDAQVEQDLVLCRALVELFCSPVVAEAVAFRGGTALHKLFFDPPGRYSEDIELVQADAGAIGPTLDAVRATLDPWLGEPKRSRGQGRVAMLYRFETTSRPVQRMRLKVEISTREHFAVLGRGRRVFGVESPWFSGRSEGGCRRKRITDLSTGDVFENVRIWRVVFCDGKTASLMPAELWRGQFTVMSVVETGVHILRDGVAVAYDWCWDAGPDGSPVSLPTLARWRTLIRQRLISAAMADLGPQLGLSWSDRLSEATQLENLLDRLSPRVLLTFRARFARACLDQAKSDKRMHADADTPRIRATANRRVTVL